MSADFADYNLRLLNNKVATENVEHQSKASSLHLDGPVIVIINVLVRSISKISDLDMVSPYLISTFAKLPTVRPRN